MKYIDLNLSWIKSIMKLRPVPTNEEMKFNHV